MALRNDAVSLWEHIIPTDGCWHWTGYLNHDGYGRLRLGGRQVMAHRAVYEAERGPIPSGLTIDHLCRNRSCVNPSHMEPVALKVNILRGTSPQAHNAAKSSCKRGHEFSGDNLGIDKHGYRYCRKCRVDGDRARYARRSA